MIRLGLPHADCHRLLARSTHSYTSTVSATTSSTNAAGDVSSFVTLLETELAYSECVEARYIVRDSETATSWDCSTTPLTLSISTWLSDNEASLSLPELAVSGSLVLSESSVSNPASGSHTSPTPTSSSSPDDGGLSLGGKLGIGFSVSFASVLALAMIIYVVRKRRRQQAETAPANGSTSPVNTHSMQSMPVSNPPDELNLPPYSPPRTSHGTESSSRAQDPVTRRQSLRAKPERRAPHHRQ